MSFFNLRILIVNNFVDEQFEIYLALFMYNVYSNKRQLNIQRRTKTEYISRKWYIYVPIYYFLLGADDKKVKIKALCKLGSFLICILIFQYVLVFSKSDLMVGNNFLCAILLFALHVNWASEIQKLICKLVIHSACAFLHHNGRSSNLNSSWVGEGAIHPCPFKA